MKNNEAMEQVKRKLKLHRELQIIPRAASVVFAAEYTAQSFHTCDEPLYRFISLGIGALQVISVSLMAGYFENHEEFNTLKKIKKELKSGVNVFENTEIEDFDIELAKQVKEYKKMK